MSARCRSMKGPKKTGAAQGKSKKARPGPDLAYDDALELKRSVEEGQLSNERLLELLTADQKACDLYDRACKGKRENPNCLCGLIPLPGGYRRKGLWQKDPEVFANIGANPSDEKRQVKSVQTIAAQCSCKWHPCGCLLLEAMQAGLSLHCVLLQSTSTPSGLNNLGNTCYVNSALQCLFMIRAFQQGLFSIDADIAQQPVIAHIRCRLPLQPCMAQGRLRACMPMSCACQYLGVAASDSGHPRRAFT